VSVLEFSIFPSTVACFGGLFTRLSTTFPMLSWKFPWPQNGWKPLPASAARCCVTNGNRWMFQEGEVNLCPINLLSLSRRIGRVSYVTVFKDEHFPGFLKVFHRDG
jgi:hypothetical protein